ncbi:MAG: hypothetical protein L0206_11675, partial [Actinobacteria bacterium]|nr:hypothetical protein [Actinomycetota bacterium]
ETGLAREGAMTKTRKTLHLVLLCFAVGAVGCGGGDEGEGDADTDTDTDTGTGTDTGSDTDTGTGTETHTTEDDICPADDCGGEDADLVGTWVFESSCRPDMPTPPCPTGTSVSTDTATGTLVINEDTSYVLTLNGTTNYTEFYPQKCLDGLSITTCADAATNPAIVPPYADRACTDACGGGCDCTASEPLAESETGTWNIRVDELELEPDGQAEVEWVFCIEGDTLTTRRDDPIVLRTWTRQAN